MFINAVGEKKSEEVYLLWNHLTKNFSAKKIKKKNAFAWPWLNIQHI